MFIVTEYAALMGETLTLYIIDKESFIQKPVFSHISVLTTKAECKLPESLIYEVIMAKSHEKHVNERKLTLLSICHF